MEHMSQILTTSDSVSASEIMPNFSSIASSPSLSGRGAIKKFWSFKSTFICRLMPCPFTGPKMFCSGPNILTQPWNLTVHSLPPKKLLCQHKKQFYWIQIIFLTGTKCLWLPQYENKFLVRHKKFEPAHFGTCKRTRH